jgi:hypothetical protein
MLRVIAIARADFAPLPYRDFQTLEMYQSKIQVALKAHQRCDPKSKIELAAQVPQFVQDLGSLQTIEYTSN